jgi:hypothetical protein
VSAALFIRSGTGWPVPKHAHIIKHYLQPLSGNCLPYPSRFMTGRTR